MPEGDTIHRAARRLAPALTDQVVTEFWAHQPRLLSPKREGRTVTGVRALGKNLLIDFDDRRALFSHMRMSGSWRVFGLDEAARVDRPETRVVLRTEAHVAVCFSAPTIELLTEPELARHPTLSALGPDLLADVLDEQEILRRLAAAEAEPLGEVVMDQRVLAGIGNVYKSEMLFMGALDPFAPVSAVSLEARQKLIRSTRTMMQANLETRYRTTRRSPGSNLWVYERRGRPCFRCRRRIQMRRQGDLARSTYFCAHCQRVAQA